MKVNKKIIERPQHLFMRVSLAIHQGNLKEALKTYDLMSEKYFIHATPTLFNAGTNRPQLSSCFLLAMKDDSIDGIFSSLRDCAMISKWAGAIGIHMHNVRAKNSVIRGTNGISRSCACLEYLITPQDMLIRVEESVMVQLPAILAQNMLTLNHFS